MAWKEAGFEMIDFIVDLLVTSFPFRKSEKHRSRPETRKRMM
jgi:hypothetical protein